MKRKIKIVFGRKAEYTYFGLLGCSHGAYSGGYNYYVYGIAGIIALEITESWGVFKN